LLHNLKVRHAGLYFFFQLLYQIIVYLCGRQSQILDKVFAFYSIVTVFK